MKHASPDHSGASAVFLSYAREDEPRARMLVEALESRDVPVWWDRELLGGHVWRDALERQIRESSWVVVLWSPRSVASGFVRAEASLAMDLGKLVPVLIESAGIPLPFDEIQRIDLSSWQGDGDSPAFRDLLAALRARVQPVDRQAPQAAGSVTGRRLRSMAWLLLPSALVMVAVLFLMWWPAPATIHVEATARRVQIRARGQSSQLLPPASVRSLALREFQNLEIPQARVSVADPAQYDLKNNTYPEAAWSALHVNGLLTLSPAGADPPTVTIRPAGAEHSLLAIHDIYASSGAEITVASPEKDNVTLRLRGVRQFGTVGLPAEFQLVADSCQATAAAWPSHHPSVTLELQLSGPRRTLEFKGPGTGVLMALEYPAGHTAPVLKPDFAVDQVEFLDLGKTGQPQSTLSGAGAIRFEDYPGAEVKLNAGDLLILENLRDFLLRRVELAGEEDSVRVRLYGKAGRVSSGPPGNVRRRGVSRFDQLWGSPAGVKVFTILVWLVPTLIAARRFLRDSDK